MAPLTFISLHATFGAECRGVDFSQPVPDETIDEIRAAMAKFGVLVFRRTELDGAGHERFARQFGEPDVSALDYSSGFGRRDRLAPRNELVDVGNVAKDGRVEPPDSLKSQLYRANNLFHVDCAYNPRRASYSILRAHQLPPKGTGGATEFADTRTAYDDLDDETKRSINDLVVCHSVIHSRRLGAPDCAILGWLRVDDFPTNHHRLVQLHEPSGRTNLYIAAHAHHYDDLTEEESRPLIQELLRHASQAKYTFKVDWRDEGDLVMWVSGRRPWLTSHGLVRCPSPLTHVRTTPASCTGLAADRTRAGISAT